MPAKQELVIIGRVDDALYQKCEEAATFLNTDYSSDFHIILSFQLPALYEQCRSALLATKLLQLPEDAKLPAVLVLDRAVFAVLGLLDSEQNLPATKGKSKNQILKEVTKALEEIQQQELSSSSSSSSSSNARCQTGDAFLERTIATTEFRLFDVPDSDPNSYLSLARQKNKQLLKARGSVFCWMVIKVNDIPIGRVVFELFQKKAPRTCENFLRLCRGDLPAITDEATKQKIDLTYKGSQITRIMKGAWIQGGDILPASHKNGTTLGYSMYGKSFPDETFEISHDSAGVLGMSNNGDNTNGSSFYVTVAPCSWMDRCFVAFGRVVDGMSVLQQVHDVATNFNQSPKVKIEISDCGETSLE